LNGDGGLIPGALISTNTAHNRGTSVSSFFFSPLAAVVLELVDDDDITWLRRSSAITISLEAKWAPLTNPLWPFNTNSPAPHDDDDVNTVLIDRG
jgi:hypothetical protein